MESGHWHRQLPQLFLALALLFSLDSTGSAQPSPPRIGYVYPAGGRQGTVFQIAVGGQFLDGVTNGYVSGAGVVATVIEFNKPMTQQQFNLLRDQLKELQERKASARTSGPRGRQAASRNSTNAWTAADEKALVEIRNKLAKNPPNRFGNPAIAETATLQVTAAAEAAAGEREIRLGTPSGLSNPLAFHIGQLPEFSEPPGRGNRDPRRPNPTKIERAAASRSAPPEMRIALPATVNGQIMPGEVDRFRFAARQGQRLVVAIKARALIPYLPDAVPGWFQATLALFDARGNELQYADHYRFHPDPVLFYEIPKDGDYAIEIKDSVYRGREDFVYRLAVGELPFVTSIFPLGGPAGAPASVELKGWNLPVTNVLVDTQSPGIRPLSVRLDDPLSNPMLFAVDTLPEALEQEPNHPAGREQTVTLPLIVNGRIAPPGDVDRFRFEGHAGGTIVAEIYARRLNSPLDSVLKLTDATGRQLAFNDDHEDKGAGLTTHHADSRLSAVLPASGDYIIELTDAQRKGGVEYAYRLRLSAPQPDFDLRVVPSRLTLRSGGTVPFTVYALRQDGCSNEIALALKDAPSGFALSGARIPANQDRVQLTLTAATAGEQAPIRLNLEGRATVAGRELVRPAVPAEDMMQAFAYRHLVPAHEWNVAVLGSGRRAPATHVLSELPVRIPAGGTARVRLAAFAMPAAVRLELELNEPPEGITLELASPSRNGVDLVLRSDKKVQPRLEGNLIVQAFRKPEAKGKTPANARRSPVGTLPAIPFEIVER